MSATAPRTAAPAFDAVGELTAACRANVLADLADAPCSDVLVPLFLRGKMLRPALVFTATAATGGDPAAALPAAEAVELLHGASLIHDDIADEATERRGLPAVHRAVGTGTAVVLGDFLIFRALSRLTDPRAFQLLTNHAETCCRGQVDELRADAAAPDAEAAYLATAARKTAALFVVACQLGPVLTAADEGHLDALGRYGLALGTAFQIRDDLLDLVGDARAVGKPLGNSLAHERPLLPVIYLHRDGSPRAKAHFAALVRAGAGREAVSRLLEEEGLIARAGAVQRAYALDAAAALTGLPPSDARALLEALARWL